MIVYNTTFHIEKDILDESLVYLKKQYIPKAVESGFCSGRACDVCCRLRREKISVYPSSFMLRISIR